MEKLSRQAALKDLRRIPGVGEKIAEDLLKLNVRSVDGLKNRDPKLLYEELCAWEGRRVDRCMLYVFRLAVYFASRRRHDPELLKWWNWKDK